jgi:5-methyltetrahydropteroyltriglutamate--homocysteine methyltransferase
VLSLPERRSPKKAKKADFPSTTVIGSYPITVPESEIEQYRAFPEETEDPVNSTIQLAVRDFVSAGIEFPSSGQTRESFVRLFLDPKYVEGIEYDGAEILVTGKIKRKEPIRLQDVQEAKTQVPRYYGFKEPITDPYTLARNCRLKGTHYSDLKELTFAIAREIVRPELESIQNLVDYLQLDAPYFSVEPFKEYIHELYEEMLSGVTVPIVLHVCGDTFSIFKELAKLNVDVISLDFTFNDKLLAEVARRNFDQQIGLGCVNTGSPIVEPVKTISGLIQRASKVLSESRIRFVHPACGERNLPLDVAYQKNIHLTLARNEVFLGAPQSARSVNLSEEEYDPNGYFLIQVDPQSQQIIVSFNSYDNVPKFRVQSSSGEKLIAAIVDNKIISNTEHGKRHLGYVGYEIGKAETALKNKVPYRQDKPLSIPGIY